MLTITALDFADLVLGHVCAFGLVGADITTEGRG
jgi:hypothetical protein